MAANNEQPKLPKEPPKKKGRPNEALRYAGIATQMAVVILLGVWLGRWLDAGREFPIFTLIFSLLSVGLALYIVIKDISR
ncbi:MAG: AtpZ/AtpI family protein [Cryomorphaceae bacterium]|nr:MAG: AtpZ/AtpI family protein [Cryomorphaceae bacterium]